MTEADSKRPIVGALPGRDEECPPSDHVRSADILAMPLVFGDPVAETIGERSAQRLH